MTNISQIMSKSSFTVKDLKDECKKRGIKGYSKLNKKQLIDKILESVQADTEDIVPIKENNIVTEDTQEKISTLHYDIDFKYSGLSIREIRVTEDNQENIEKALNEEINSNDKYKFGDIITNVEWISTSDRGEASRSQCYSIICKDGLRKKPVCLCNYIFQNDIFINEHSYLKNINFDQVMKEINKEDCFEPFEDGPLIFISEFYFFLNNKSEEISKKIDDIRKKLNDEGRPDVILSTLEILEVEF